MKFIAHRGNVHGKIQSLENKPSHIDTALNLGYDAEIDVWILNNVIYLGHDEPETEILLSFLEKRSEKLWCHAKNLEALEFLIEKRFNCFFHDKDDYTLTSKGNIWAYPGTKLNKNTICVMPEMCNNDNQYKINDILNSYGVCSDSVSFYRDQFILLSK